LRYGNITEYYYRGRIWRVRKIQETHTKFQPENLKVGIKVGNTDGDRYDNNKIDLNGMGYWLDSIG
jgi:hypothetical protein